MPWPVVGIDEDDNLDQSVPVRAEEVEPRPDGDGSASVPRPASAGTRGAPFRGPAGAGAARRARGGRRGCAAAPSGLSRGRARRGRARGGRRGCAAAPAGLSRARRGRGPAARAGPDRRRRRRDLRGAAGARLAVNHRGSAGSNREGAEGEDGTMQAHRSRVAEAACSTAPADATTNGATRLAPGPGSRIIARRRGSRAARGSADRSGFLCSCPPAAGTRRTHRKSLAVRAQPGTSPRRRGLSRAADPEDTLREMHLRADGTAAGPLSVRSQALPREAKPAPGRSGLRYREQAGHREAPSHPRSSPPPRPRRVQHARRGPNACRLLVRRAGRLGAGPRRRDALRAPSPAAHRARRRAGGELLGRARARRGARDRAGGGHGRARAARGRRRDDAAESGSRRSPDGRGTCSCSPTATWRWRSARRGAWRSSSPRTTRWRSPSTSAAPSRSRSSRGRSRRRATASWSRAATARRSRCSGRPICTSSGASPSRASRAA